MRILLLFLCSTPIMWAQGGFEKSKKQGNDYLQVRNHGYQFSLGPTYSFVNQPLQGDFLVNQVDRGNYSLTPEAKLGFYAEFGLAHFPKWKGTPIKALGKSRVMDYFDWGIGYRQINGLETTLLEIQDANSSNYSITSGEGQMRTGYLYGSIRAHSLIYFGKKVVVKVRKHFLDQSLGLNYDLQVRADTLGYQNLLAAHPVAQLYQPNLAAGMLQFNYQIGIGIRLNKAWILIPGVSLPIVTLTPWQGFNANIHWFSSTYWPVQAQFKVIKLFEAPTKCGVYSTPEDRDMEKQYRMDN
ncbi:MAG: hypothetical protein LW839_04750 [Cryomorphaceae bacterium]|jgi:hypothetical protein|nr:hypothetical protein [Cryomorphaceae bacterium]